MFYIENPQTDPCYNLALEQALFERLPRGFYCMLWQNEKAVIVGRHQITTAEINAAFTTANNIAVVRRLSGGGAVYHDLGNINFTFITDTGDAPGISTLIDFSFFCEPIVQALRSFGVAAEIFGRNDMAVNGMKISGNAQYIHKGRALHHGTLLFDTNLETLDNSLNAGNAVQSKGIKSVKGKVCNIRPHMKTDMTADAFRTALQKRLSAAFSMVEFKLSAEDRAAAETLRDTVYSQWSWNYGASPPFNIRKAHRYEGCGTVEALIDVAAGGSITHIAFHGDFFGSEDPAQLAALLGGRRFERREVAATLASAGGTDISRYFHNLDAETFLSLLFE